MRRQPVSWSIGNASSAGFASCKGSKAHFVVSKAHFVDSKPRKAELFTVPRARDLDFGEYDSAMFPRARTLARPLHMEN